ncbi:hypothetical protein CES85_2984 (plasmid) [Ochrobactrum quorumnocens]|uniref:Uncharacterized protein n=1 Tax=Ochrobactrum quorumnocens TaxID=271865 RepID=A0A248UPJ2_9HYPH|nr:hypothetical protein CES85_2984 [[Ochrobactrum] quorumnocens]
MTAAHASHGANLRCLTRGKGGSWSDAEGEVAVVAARLGMKLLNSNSIVC